ncbi:MAG: kappa-carrageenase [Rhodopirellula sp. JB053]
MNSRLVILSLLTFLMSALCSIPNSNAEKQPNQSAPSSSNAPSARPAPASDPTNSGDWIFREDISDDFDGEAIDLDKWNIDTEDWGTWSWEPENAYQSEGAIHLKMIQEDHQRGDKKLAYKSGIARQYATITYGYFEARVKGCNRFPGASPAFWLHSKGPENRYHAKNGETVAYSEIDVIELQQGEFNFETKKNTGVDVIDCNLHAVLIRNGKRQWIRPGTHPETNKNEYHASFDPREDFHIYAVENTPDFVIWYIDGEEIARKPNLYWHLPMHITLSLGLRRPFENYQDGARVAVLDKTTQEGFPTEMIVDYVRVWTSKALPTRPEISSRANGFGMNMDQFVAMEKAKWLKKGWRWDRSRVETAFAEMDTNHDGIASGTERKKWFAQRKSSQQ